MLPSQGGLFVSAATRPATLELEVFFEEDTHFLCGFALSLNPAVEAFVSAEPLAWGPVEIVKVRAGIFCF